MSIRIVVVSGPPGSGATAARVASDITYEFDAAAQRVTIGRGSAADVRLPHRHVSERHCTLKVADAGWTLFDEGSTNGTWVAGTRLVPGRGKLLRPADRIGVGGFTLSVELGAPVRESTHAERTAALARRLVREVLGESPTAPPKVIVVEGPDAGKTLALDAVPMRALVGRAEAAELQLTDADASREHAELVRDLDGVLVRDLGAKNGVRVNGRVVKERRLRDGDEIALGATRMAFEEPADAYVRMLDAEADLAVEGGVGGGDRAGDSDGPGNGPGAGNGTGPGTETPDAEPDAAADAPLPSPARDDKTDRTKRPAPTSPARSAVGIDAVIYALAAVVLAASAIALWFLLRA